MSFWEKLFGGKKLDDEGNEETPVVEATTEPVAEETAAPSVEPMEEATPEPAAEENAASAGGVEEGKPEA